MKPLTLGVIDIDHRHIYGQLANLQALGCTCKGWWTDGEPETLEGFVKRFPDVPRVDDRQALLDDPDIDLILMAGIPAVRAGRALEAMRAGKDVMTDKPGCTTLEQLEAIRACVAETGRIWSIDFSERFEVPAVSASSVWEAQVSPPKSSPSQTSSSSREPLPHSMVRHPEKSNVQSSLHSRSPST